MFFKVHKEGKIGYKRLSDADLGLGVTSHQTHIGLFGDILTFLDDQEVVQKVMFIYKQDCDIMDCYFDRIMNPNGTYRSPKIKTGGDGVVSLVSVIRDIVENHEKPTVWYLVWFGLESEELVFYLFCQDSYYYSNMSLILNLKSKENGKITQSDKRFKPVISYLENLVNTNSAKIVSELEVVSQTGSIDRKYRTYDIEKADKLFKDIGQKGELIIKKYLERLKELHHINNFSWMNERRESGLPYDFTIQDNRQNITHIDVKSTSYSFEQPMIFSGQEIDYVAHTPDYQIYRVYSLSEEESHLKICPNSSLYMSSINRHVQDFYHTMQSCNIKLNSVKLAIPTTGNLLTFGGEIIL